MLEYCGGDTAFAAWLQLVDDCIMDQLGVGVFDLTDYMWRDAYDDERSPADAVDDFIEADGSCW